MMPFIKKSIKALAALTLFIATPMATALPASAAAAEFYANIWYDSPTASTGVVELGNNLNATITYTIKEGTTTIATKVIPAGVGERTLNVPYTGLHYGETLSVFANATADPNQPIATWPRPAMVPKTVGLTSNPSTVVVPPGSITTGATLVLNGVDPVDNPAPGTIQVTDSTGSTYTVPCTVQAIAASCSLGLPAGATVTSASAVVASGWNNTFILSAYQTVAAGPTQATTPQQAPVAHDEDGTANDTITVYAGGKCWSDPLLNGVSHQPGTYPVVGIADGKGNVVVSYNLLPNCVYRYGTSFSFPSVHFNETLPKPPADTQGTVHVEVCHATGQADKFVAIDPSVESLKREGHLTHQDGRDKIAPYNDVENGTKVSFPGRNWDQAFYNRGCKDAVTNPGSGDNPGSNPTPQPNPNPGSDHGSDGGTVSHPNPGSNTGSTSGTNPAPNKGSGNVSTQSGQENVSSVTTSADHTVQGATDEFVTGGAASGAAPTSLSPMAGVLAIGVLLVLAAVVGLRMQRRRTL